MDNKKFYTVEEMAEILCVTKNTIYRNIRAGKINAIKVVGSVRIPAEEMERLLGKK